MAFPRSLMPLLLLAALTGLPASAQLAPGSPWQASKWDFLNLYQGSTTSTQVKPEILFAVDQSGSTSRLMYHPLFPNNWQDETPPNILHQTQDEAIVLYNSDTSWTVDANGHLGTGLQVGFSTSWNATKPDAISSGGHSAYTYNFSASGNNYTVGGARGTVTVNSITYPYNCLIKPDGTEVSATDVTTAFGAGQLKNMVAWMMCASHVRMQLTAINGTTMSSSTPIIGPRTIDFPLFWRPIDSTSTISSGGLVTATATGGVALDTSTGTTNPAVGTTVSGSNTQQSVSIFGGYQDDTYQGVSARYIEWVFIGEDPATGYFCIPNAIPSATAAIQSAIDPTSVAAAYQGSSGSYSGWSNITSASTTTFANSPVTALMPSGTNACPPKGLSVGWFTSFDNGLPNRTRCQGIKEALIKSYIANASQAMFAVRFLDNEIGDNSLTDETDSPGGNWTYLTSTANLSTVQSYLPNGSTPMVETFTNAYCQFTNPAAFSAQIIANGYSDAQMECQHHFLIFLTDGAPSTVVAANESTCSYPYLSSTVPSGCSGDWTYGGYVPPNEAYAGNAAVKTDPGQLASSGNFWNPCTVAGIAAHGGQGSATATAWIKNPTTETLSGSFGTGTNWLPMWVTKRTTSGGVYTLQTPQPIQTFTVGVSLGVDFGTVANPWVYTQGAPTVATPVIPIQSDVSGSKFRLLAAACSGDPSALSYDISTSVPFYLLNTGEIGPSAVYFFDGRDPATLVANLIVAVAQAEAISYNTSTSAPVFPTLGAGLGNEVYAATFLPSNPAGPIWTGDVLMYPTQATATGVNLLATNGTPISGALSSSNAQWSAATAIANKPPTTTPAWINRNIFTRLPSTTAVWNQPIVQIKPGSDGLYGTGASETIDPGFNSILSLLPGTTNTLKLKNWQFYVGADVGTGQTPLGSRTDTILGDIIDSTPAVLQYSTLPNSITSGPCASSILSSAWSSYGSVSTTAFRCVFFGDNQGLFHCMGEVSWITTASNGVPVTQGVVDELWAFAPTEILPNIDQLQVTANLHHYAVDGPPAIYLLDLPQGPSASAGDGIYQVVPYPFTESQYPTGNAYSETAIVVFGLGKGGRSYYAININDPGNPAMAWAYCPNEEYNMPTSRILGGTATAATNFADMGMSTPQPTMARVATTASGYVSQQIVDSVLLGGGYSDPLIEAALPSTATVSTIASIPATAKLGRSVTALDVSTGNVLNSWSNTGTSTAGPVNTAVIPLELNAGTGIIERAYYADYYGTLWALGCTTLDTTYNTFRVDTPIVNNWSSRQVYSQPAIGSTTQSGNGLVTSSPTPFLIPYYPVTRTTTPIINPPAVGVALLTGDRNNPLDNYTFTTWSAPTQHRLDVVFDRQDVQTTLNAASLANAGGGSFNTTPSSSTYYLINNSGYYINFAAPPGVTQVAPFVPKGINSAEVLEGNLFYSVFDPQTATCEGGTGITTTYQVCNVMAPVANTGLASAATAVNGCLNGAVLSWTGIASNITARNTFLGAQAGNTSGSGTTNNPGSPQNLTIQNLPATTTDKYPKIRIWRVVH